MSMRRILGIGVLATVAAVALVVAAVVWQLVEFGERFNRHIDEGLLGPADQRQRIEVPAYGLVVSIADDWTVEVPLPDPQRDERLGMHVLLTIDPAEEDAACSVYLAAGAAPLGHPADEARSDSEILGDAATHALGPWFGEQGLQDGEWGGTVGDSWGGKAGFSFGEDSGSTGAVWVVPHEEDLYVLSCSWTAGRQDQPRPEFWGRSHWLMLTMEPMAESFEFLPAEE